MNNYSTRGPEALGKVQTRSVNTTKKLEYYVTVKRSDGKPVTGSDYIKALELATKQAIRREAKAAGQEIIRKIEWLRDNHEDLYSRFAKGERLSDLLDEAGAGKRLGLAIRSGALK
jgi:hypothetical protein